MNQTLFASYFVQAGGALLTAAIFAACLRAYPRPFLADWTRSWIACGIMMACGGVSAVLAMEYGVAAAAPVRLGFSLVAGAAAYLHVGWLLLGTYALRAERPPSLRVRRLTLALAVVFGAAASLAFIGDPSAGAQRFLLRVGIRGAVTAVAFFVTALAIWRYRAGQPIGAGRRLVALAFLVYAIDLESALWAGRLWLVSPKFGAFRVYTGFLDFVLGCTIGLGVVIWLLEEEKRAAHEFAERIGELAYHDALTGLPNRQLFLDHLSLALPQARREEHRLAVFFFDLDRFKIINDSLGHGVGDRLLQIVAHRVRNALREHDTVARMGGDEFTLLTPVVRSVDEAAHVALKVHEAIRRPIVVDGRELFVTASIGISVYPDDGETAETLLKNADTAMYRAKSAGGDQFQLYTPAMNAHALEQLALESALRHAVTGGQLRLHYQPIVEMATGRVTAVEAMLRWQHPTLGLLRPQHFLELAETTGAIVGIGEWALRESTAAVARWRRDRGLGDLRLALNVSRRQLQQADFVERVRDALAAHALPPAALELDVSETHAAQCGPEAIASLGALRALGVRVAIDDFGTGFSSVTRLRAFPVDSLKIDTEVVRELTAATRDARVARAVIALARALGLSVTAEGVENVHQLEILREQRCEAWQGYLCAEPLAEEAVFEATERKRKAYR